MQNSTDGRLLEFQAAMKITNQGKAGLSTKKGQTLLLEPRSVRHQERVEDLFYLLFKRTSA